MLFALIEPSWKPCCNTRNAWKQQRTDATCALYHRNTGNRILFYISSEVAALMYESRNQSTLLQTPDTSPSDQAPLMNTEPQMPKRGRIEESQVICSKDLLVRNHSITSWPLALVSLHQPETGKYQRFG